MSYSTPVLSGSVPNPVTQPLQGVLNWTQSNGGVPVSAALLLHCDGTNGSTTFTDTSGSGNVVTANGVTVSTSNPEFGTGSAQVALTSGANTKNMTCPIVTDGPLDLNTGSDFTLEWSLRYNVVTGGSFMCDCAAPIGSGSPFAWAVNGNSGTLQFIQYYNNNTALDVISPTIGGGFVVGTWYQCAVVRASGVYTFYINGMGGVPITAAHPLRGTKGTLVFGYGAGSYAAPVNLDEIRITNSALYTMNYTPAVGPFSDGGGQVPATGYDIYRNGVPLVQVGQVLTYTDTVPSAGTYAYNVAAYVGGMDVSPESNEVDLTYTTNVVLGIPNCIFDEAIYGGYFGGQLNLVEFTYMPGRTPFEEGATNLIINRYKQEPTDSRQRGVDFTQFVVPGELLQTVAVTGISAQGVPQASTSPVVTPLVITDLVIDPVTQLKFGYTVSGGQNGIEYTVQFTTTTNIQTETLEEIFSINIMIEDSFP